MGFWLFMLLLALLSPVIMLIAGICFCHAAPQKIQSFYGYRTERSMKNRKTWEFAHRVCGRFWLVCGAVLLPLCTASMLLVRHMGETVIAVSGLCAAFLSLIALLVTSFLTEAALRRTFDHNGIRK